jgi:hypothetical protein
MIQKKPIIVHDHVWRARYFQVWSARAGDMAAHGGEVHRDANGLADGKVEGGCCILPEGNGDCGEPFVQRIGGVAVLGEKGTDFGVDVVFPFRVDGDVEENPAGLGCARILGVGMARIAGCDIYVPLIPVLTIPAKIKANMNWIISSFFNPWPNSKSIVSELGTGVFFLCST